MRRTITWILYILMGVQIVLGCVWFVTNFGAVQEFRENLFVSLPMGAVSLVQLVLAAASTWYAAGKFGFGENKYSRAYVCAFLLTVPYLLQMHTARLVWSLSLTAFLWMMGLLLETRKSGLSGRRAALLLISWFLYGILCPDGLWLGGIVLFTGIWAAGRKGRKDGRAQRREAQAGRESAGLGTGLCFGAAAVLAAGAICIANAGLNKALPKERTIYRENTFGAAVASRFVWPNFGKNYYFWNEDIRAVLPESEATWIDRREDLVGEEFYPLLEETYGKKKAIELCIRMGRNCLEIRTKEVLGEIGRDLKDYVLLPFTIERNLKGEGTSLTAWNYGRMNEKTPALTKYYYRYGAFSLPFLLLGSFLLWSFEKRDRKISAEWRFMLFIVILYALWYTLRSNIPIDYKVALPILFIWYLASASGVMANDKNICRLP